MTNKMQNQDERKRLFVLEDNPRAISALELACKTQGLELDVSTNFTDAEEKLRGNYDYHFFDLHVPYSDGAKQNVDPQFSEDFRKYMSELPLDIPSEAWSDIIFGDIPEMILPIGYILARRMKDAGKDYLITSSITHNKVLYEEMQRKFDTKGIQCHIGHAGSPGANPKFEQEYWINSLEKMKGGNK